MALSGVPLPDRLRDGLTLIESFAADGIHLAGVRHHSPTCARAVRTLIERVRPAIVLIEGPEEYTALIPELLRPQTRPPVALLSQDASGTGFFPLAEYSPEWVALRAGAEVGAELAFIDLAWAARPGREPGAAGPVVSEAALAHSRTLAEVARREHCRDHDELWDHLIELRPDLEPDAVFRDVAVWAALARLDATEDELRADGSLAREERMASWIRAAAGPVVVVTGAFHTLALAESLAAGGGPVPQRRSTDPAWLIRYDFARLDALHGYGAGMRSPGFYQRGWSGQSVTALLVEVAEATRRSADPVSTAEVIAAAEAAHRLAVLRGHPAPGRWDLLDAITSCFVGVAGDWPPAVRDAVAEVFGGSALGEVPPDTAAPPLVAEAREQARRHRLTVTDSTPRRTEVDRLRSPAHRGKGRFLALMGVLGTGFARQLSGPDLIAGTGTGRLVEEWEYAWTPLVEAELVRLAGAGGGLLDLAVARLRAEIDELAERAAESAVLVLSRAVAIGVADRLPDLAGQVRARLDQDPAVGSLLSAAHHLLRLWRGRDALDLGAAPVRALLEVAIGATVAATAALGDAPADHDRDAIHAVLGLDQLADELEHPSTLRRELHRLTTAPSPAVCGAALAVGVARGEVSDHTLAAAIAARLGSGADPVAAVRFLTGVLHAGPDLVIRDDGLRRATDAAVQRMSPETFLTLLPDLRHAFGRLRPRDTALLAERLHADGVVGAVDVAPAAWGAEQLSRGIALEQALRAELAGEGLR